MLLERDSSCSQNPDSRNSFVGEQTERLASKDSSSGKNERETGLTKKQEEIDPSPRKETMLPVLVMHVIFFWFASTFERT